ncbi:hypothetical protein ACPOL_3908 [Acidisarcina polymorpha]|uniref:Uncharacterized protein n=1 Tax=Acidisarcina polymorpha TaxID=2211140 RepID=A0A2Z5G3D5_9BACT|nr:hypothetical protein ACPOL_3908 [Acidisarcina polymorpha]
MTLHLDGGCKACNFPHIPQAVVAGVSLSATLYPVLSSSSSP